ncbi:MAG: DUF1206 domain-containing protein [Rhodobacteraceae bacterium]|mgnify:CR=1 FL=1|jgi:hypothetical protein|uniref:DUF1206 domain-containing protein n=1 Tax=Salipiger profundus TaxID=1229727 RepID=A0A1U7D6F1_9RHOB|nr:MULTISPECIES: DUF1206 domain-containing protein [Salipiger]APX23757.1 protein of unknown function (DUF1206) [Salipiger profundus]MAB07085.1 DUF1206 domain-containing protein [Paracoccaceae bacterium]GGA17744.1 membrane protein [Salipiger profundus]SFD29887.1 protein of unknown function [Salipiger profundus]
MSDNRAPAWVVPVMRAGYAARGAVYTVVGGLALFAAWRGGSAEGTTDALAQLTSVPWGVALLWAIAIGLIAYMVWRLIDAWMDLECYGSEAKGIVARAGQVITGLIHGAIGVSVATTAMNGGGGGESGTQSMTQKLMSMPWGPYLVMAVGIATVGAGIYYAKKGISEDYKKDIRVTPLARKLDPVMKFGLVAEGVVIGIIGATIIYAGFTHNPGEAGGVGTALDKIRSVAYGRVLLGVVALGLIGFAVENFIEAAYRIVPRRAGDDVMTLARRAKLKAEGKLEQATA